MVKVGRDQTSIDTYGKRIKVIIDKDIKDPDTALDRLTKELSDNANPKKVGTIDIRGIVDITPSQTAIINLPHQGIDNKTYEILTADYEFDTFHNSTERVLRISVNKKIDDITDTIKNLINNVRTIQSQDVMDSSELTRYETSTGSIGIRHSGVQILESSVTGSTYYLYGTSFVPPVNPFKLASGTGQGTLAGSYTGSAQAFSTFSVTWSGGYF